MFYINTTFYCTILMDDHTYNNWVRIKETFEKSGNIDNLYYKRACQIVKTKKDPLEKIFKEDVSY